MESDGGDWRIAASFCSLLLCCSADCSTNNLCKLLNIVAVAALNSGSSGIKAGSASGSYSSHLHCLRARQTNRCRSAASSLRCCLNRVY